MMAEIASAIFCTASQSSALYVSRLCFQVASFVTSHFDLHSRLRTPDGSSVDHLKPRKAAISLRPFEYVGK